MNLLSVALAAPVASITGADLVIAGDTINLSGADSTGNQLRYRWKILSSPAGSTAQLNSGALTDASFTADREGVYLVELRVLEGNVWSSPKYKTISSVVSAGEVVLSPEVYQPSFLCKITFGLYDCEEVVRNFTVDNPTGSYSLIIENSGVKKAFLNLNNTDLTDYYQLSGDNETVSKKVTLSTDNQLRLKFGRPGSFGELNGSIKIKIVKNLFPSGDNVAPTASAAPITFHGSMGGQTQLTIFDADQVGGHLISILVPAKNGDVAISETGVITYSPDLLSTYENDEVVLLIKDNGKPQKAFALVIPINFSSDNTPPVLASLFPRFGNGQSLTGQISVKDTEGQHHTYAIIEQGQHGTAFASSSGVITYVPADDYIGLDAFKVRVTDDGSPAASADILIPVETLENHVPNLSAPTIQMDQGLTDVRRLEFSDIDDGQELNIYIKTIPTFGQAVLNPDGSLFYTPDPKFYGQDYMDVAVKDNGHPGKETVVRIPITVNENKPPVVYLSQYNLKISPGFTAQIYYSYNDVNYNQGHVVNISQPAHGRAVLKAGYFEYTPDDAFYGTDEVIVSVTDDGLPAKTGFTTFKVIVEENHPPAPLVIGDLRTAGKERHFYINPNDPDIGQSFTYSISSYPSHGTLIPAPYWNSEFIYTPEAGYVGPDTMKITVADNGLPIKATEVVISMDVRENSAPIIPTLPVLTLSQQSAINYSVQAFDPDGDQLVYSIVENPRMGTASFYGNIFTYKADKGLSGSEILTLEVRDNGNPSQSTTKQIQINVDANHAPAPQNQTILSETGRGTSVIVRPNDPDSGQEFKFQVVQQPAHGTLKDFGYGNYTYQSETGYLGNDEFVVRVTDNGTPALSGDAKITLTVQQNFPPKPTANSIKIIQGTIGFSKIFPNDPNPNQIAYYAVASPPVNGSTFIDSNGNISYSPNPDFYGQDQIIFTVTDNGSPALSANIAVTIEVEKNLPPNPTVGATSVFQGNTLQIDINPNDPNTIQQSFTYEVIQGPLNGTLTGGFTRWFYTPGLGFSGQDSIKIKVTDSGYPRLSTIKTIPIEVVVNNSPIVIASDSIQTFQSTGATSQISYTDPDPGQLHNFYIKTPPLHGTASISSLGLLTYNPYIGYAGPDELTVQVNDNAVPNGIGTKKINISVVGNTNPTVIANDITIFQGETGSTTVSFTDPDVGQGHSTYISSYPMYGSVYLDSNTGKVTYNPYSICNTLQDSFKIAVTDTANPQGLGEKIIHVNVTPNTAPIVTFDDFAVTQRGIYTKPIIINDPDVGQTVSYSWEQYPQHGFISISQNGELTYQHNGDESLTDRFIIVARDNIGYTCENGVSKKVVNVAISPNRPPVLTIDSQLMVEKGSVGHLRATKFDPDEHQNTYFSLSGPVNHGNISLDDQGEITYTPFPDFVGDDSIQVKVFDNGNPQLSDEKVVNVKVVPLNFPPVPTANSISLLNGKVASTTIAPNDPDVSQIHTYELLSPPLYGWATVDNSSGVLTYHAFEGIEGSEYLQVKVTDNGDFPRSAIIQIPVEVVKNLPPSPVSTVIADAVSGMSVKFKVLPNDPNELRFPQVYTYSIANSPADGTVTVNSDGEVTYMAPVGFTGKVEFDIGVSDDGTPSLAGLSHTTITVVANAAPSVVAQTLNTLKNVSANKQIEFTDVNSSRQKFSFSLSTNPAHGSVEITEQGLLTYSPALNYFGPDEFIVRVTDNGNPALSGVAIYSVNVADSSNTPPTLGEIQFTTASNELPSKYEFVLSGMTDAEGSVKEVKVNFGDNSEVLVLNDNSPLIKSGKFSLDKFEHIYKTNGVFNVVVTLTDNESASAKYQTAVQVGNNLPPVARVNFSSLSGSIPLVLTADASSSTDSDGAISRYCLTIKKEGTTYFDNCSQSSLVLSTTLTNAGIYTAQACVTDNGHSVDCVTQNIYAGVEVPANGAYKALALIDVNQHSGIAPLNLTLNASRSQGFNGASIVEYQWGVHAQVDTMYGQKFDKYYSGVNPVINFPYAGTYDVSLTVIDSNGNVGYATTEINATNSAASSLAMFVISRGDNNYQLKLNTSGLAIPSDKIFWEVDSTSAIQGNEAFITLTTGQVHTINLTAYDYAGNKWTTSKVVDLTDSPTAPAISLQSMPQTVQLNTNFALNASGSHDDYGALRFRWWMGDGTVIDGVGASYSQINHTYSALGDKTIRLMVTNLKGITSEVEFSTKVIKGQLPTLMGTISPNSGIAPLVVNATSAATDPDGTILGYTWNFDSEKLGRIKEGQNISNTYFQPGSYRVSLTVLDNDGNSVTQFIDSVDVEGFNKTPVVLGANLTVSQDSTLSYDVKYTDDDDVAQTHTFSIETAPAHGTATISTKGRVSYQPTSGYIGPDSIKVRVTDSASIPAYGEATLNIQVVGTQNQPPVVAGLDYAYETSSFPRETYLLANQLNDPDGKISKITWDFGDGTTPLTLDSTQVDSLNEVLHYYKQAGTYTATLTAEDDQGAKTSQTMSVVMTANQTPVSKFGFTTTGTGPFQTTFNASNSTDSDGSITKYCWHIEKDGIVNEECLTTPTKTVTFNTAGQAFVSLYVVDNNHGGTYYETNFNVGSANSLVPFAASTTTGNRLGALPLSLPWTSALSSALQGKTISKKYWESSDWQYTGKYFDGGSITADYLFPGTHVTRLFVVDSDGKINSRDHLVYAGLNVPLKTDFTARMADTSTVEFNAADWTSGHLTGLFMWDFGDGTIGTDRWAEHVYNRSGVYEVTLTVLDIYGNVGTKTAQVEVGGTTPAASFIGNFKAFSNINAPISFTVNGDSNDTIRWSFGDGQFDSGYISDKGTVTHTFSIAGIYRLRSTVTSRVTGLSRDFYNIVEVVNGITNPNAQISASQTSGHAPFTANFIGNYDPSFVPTNFRWILKNDRGEIIYMSTVSTASYTFTKPGNYTMEYIIRDAAGNRDYANTGITVSNNFALKTLAPRHYKKKSFREERRLKLLKLLSIKE